MHTTMKNVLLVQARFLALVKMPIIKLSATTTSAQETSNAIGTSGEVIVTIITTSTTAVPLQIRTKLALLTVIKVTAMDHFTMKLVATTSKILTTDIIQKACKWKSKDPAECITVKYMRIRPLHAQTAGLNLMAIGATTMMNTAVVYLKPMPSE